MSSLIQCPIRESPEKCDDLSSTNHIESALKVTNLTCFEQVTRSREKIKLPSQRNSTKETDLFSNIVTGQDAVDINDSLASFEQHELTQSTPSQFYQMTYQNSVATFNASEITEKSTPFVQVEKTSNSTATSSCESTEDYKEKFKKFLDNLNTSDLHMFGGDVKSRNTEDILANEQNNTSCYTYSQRDLPGTDRTAENDSDLTILSTEN